MKPRVSVVVPTYRRPALLERCLGALAAQTLPAADYEIIVVHDGPGHESRAAAVHAVERAVRAPAFVAATESVACPRSRRSAPRANHVFLSV